jgi:hypothetical protein
LPDVAPQVRAVCIKDHLGLRGDGNFPVPGQGNVDHELMFRLFLRPDLKGRWQIERVDGRDGASKAAPDVIDQRHGPSPIGRHEYRLPGGGDDVVRVFYLTHAETAQRLQEIATSMAEIRRLFIYNAPRAMAVRGTAGQIALADRLIQERDK